MSTQQQGISRRDYLKKSLLGAGVMAIGGFTIGCNLFSKSKLNIALVGSGGIAKTAFKDIREENVVAIAEVDDVTGAPGLEEFPNATRYRDFRKMLDAHYKELDLVIINTPDHTHFNATYDAIERGIAVHTQKPLTHNIWQARTLQAAAKKFKVQTVMGNQGHNFEGMRLIKDWYDLDMIGEVKEVHAWTGRTTTNNLNAQREFPAQPVPETLNWDLWMGPTKERPYNKAFCPKGWRWHWDYGLGGLGDIGCHTLDIPVYVMGLGYPSAVYMADSLDFRHEFDDKAPKLAAATYVYEFPANGDRPAVKVYWYEGGRMPKFPKEVHAETPEVKKAIGTGGCMMIGSNNTLLSPSMRPVRPKLIDNWDEISQNPADKITPRPVGNPVQEIKAAIRGDIDKCGSNFDYAVPLTETVILGTIANRSNKKVVYNPKEMTFNDASLNEFIKEPVRKGWEIGDGLI